MFDEEIKSKEKFRQSIMHLIKSVGENHKNKFNKPKRKVFVICNMPKKVRVGRSLFCFAKRVVVGKIGGKIRFFAK